VLINDYDPVDEKPLLTQKQAHPANQPFPNQARQPAYGAGIPGT
jgi:hypothetical protein